MVSLTHDVLDRRWSRAPHSLVDGIVASAPTVLEKYEINTRLRLAHFLAQISEETGGGTALEEHLNYSAERAHEVWPSRFPTVASAMPYANSPRLIADAAYNGRMGNRPGTDDGWTFRGRGLIQLTGHDLYAEIGAICGLDLINHPDLASDPNHCLDVAGAYWKRAGVNAYADRDDLKTETLRINGGLTNLAARQAWLALWKQEQFGAPPAAAPTVAPPAPKFTPPSPGTVLSIGSEGDDVRWLQDALGMSVTDGVFGTATRNAVAEFQRGAGLGVDGTVGKDTLQALFALRDHPHG